MVAERLSDTVTKGRVKRRVDMRRHDFDDANLVVGDGIQLLAQRDAETVDRGFGGAVDGVEAEGDVAEPGGGEEEGGRFAERDKVRE